MSKMLLVSNMYPNQKYAEYGTFVKNFHDQMETKFSIDKSVLNKKGNSKIKKIQEYFLFHLKTLFKLLRNDYDIVYIHYISHSSIVVLLLPKKYKIISNVHGSDIKPKGRLKELYKYISKKILEKSDLVVVPTEYYKEKTIEFSNIRSGKIFVSPSSGINQDIFNSISNKKKNSKFVIGFAGRIVSEKGWKTLLNAIEILGREDIILKIVGNGKEENELLSMISKKKLDSIVFWENSKSQEDLATFYSEIDSFIFPSESESLGLVGIEAMACNCLLIGSDIPAILSYLEDQKNGYVFENGNALSLSEVIIKVKNLDEHERSIILANAKITANKYNSEKVSKELETRIKELIVC